MTHLHGAVIKRLVLMRAHPSSPHILTSSRKCLPAGAEDHPFYLAYVPRTTLPFRPKTSRGNRPRLSSICTSCSNSEHLSDYPSYTGHSERRVTNRRERIYSPRFQAATQRNKVSNPPASSFPPSCSAAIENVVLFAPTELLPASPPLRHPERTALVEVDGHGEG